MAGIILAGGRGNRLRVDKAALVLGGRTLLEMVAERLQGVAGELIVVGSAGQELSYVPARVVQDVHPDLGPLGGILTGLLHSRDEANFVAACDAPFLEPNLVRLLLSVSDDADVVIPAAADGLHPLCGAYRRSCVEPIRRALRAGRRRVISFYCWVRVRYLEEERLRRVDPELWSLFNLNTWQDYARAQARLAAEARTTGCLAV